MPTYFKNIGLDFFTESEETYRSLIGFAVEKGKAICGYYGLPYFNIHFGNPQVVVRTGWKVSSGEKSGIEVLDVDTHISGRCIWDVKLQDININPKGADILEKKVAISTVDGEGLAIVNLVNADVLPSFLGGDIVKMQMVALPRCIDYYVDEDDYSKCISGENDAEVILIGEGSIIPTGLLRNRNPESEEFESDERLDDLSAIRGVVKSLHWGILKLGDERQETGTFIKCIIETQFGDLEIVHDLSQINERSRENMKVGATVVMFGALSGDVAIFEYDQGIIRDEWHNLAVLRYAFSGHDPERIRTILDPDAVYISERAGEQFNGADKIIERMNKVQSENSDKYYAHFARITSIDDGDEELPYSVDQQCLVLASKEETNYESIVFIEMNEENNIFKIVTSKNPRYHFTIV